MLVKICGISNYIDVIAAVKHGADALGFVMGGWVQPAEVEPHAQTVREISKQIPSYVQTYLVTHLTNVSDILALAEYMSASGIQVSEDIGLSKLKKLRFATAKKIIKTVVVQGESSLQKLQLYEPFCDYLLLDSRIAGYTGGTGMVSDWNVCKKLTASAKKPVFLAGGLTPKNISKAIQTVRPAGVDVSTGVSAYAPMYFRKDRKDEEKIKQFIALAKSDLPLAKGGSYE